MEKGHETEGTGTSGQGPQGEGEKEGRKSQDTSFNTTGSAKMVKPRNPPCGGGAKQTCKIAILWARQKKLFTPTMNKVGHHFSTDTKSQ